MNDLSPEFRSTLRDLFVPLARALQHAEYDVRLDPAGHRGRLDEDLILVPVRYEVHWRRFRTIPTELVRDVVFEAHRRSGRGDEADWMVAAEAYVRDHVLEAS